MKTICYLLTTVILYSCKKDQALPETEPNTLMMYQELGNQEIGVGTSQSIDIDQNGTNDLFFSITERTNPITGINEYCAIVFNLTGTYFPVKNEDQVPILSLGDKIHKDFFKTPTYKWSPWNTTYLAKKQINLSSTHNWEGPWVGGSHKYIPFFIEWILGSLTYGWIEISFDANRDKIILHRSAVAHINEFNKVVRAGN